MKIQLAPTVEVACIDLNPVQQNFFGKLVIYRISLSHTLAWVDSFEKRKLHKDIALLSLIFEFLSTIV